MVFKRIHQIIVYLCKDKKKERTSAFQMLSICIPIFNFDVTRLVNDLRDQAIGIGHPFEIILMDDASDEKFQKTNRKLNGENIRYIQLDENIGRSRIRNKLAESACYPYLIFMDCDSSVPSENYIQSYLPFCKPSVVCYGGRIYENRKPDKKFLLRWKYGVCRESLPAMIRKKNPNHSFCTNNFLIHKQIFEQIRFNEELAGYGHEDTYFGLELSAKKITIQHIDNPLIHIGLESASEFLGKTRNGVVNLIKVDKLLSELYPEYINHSKLIRTRNRLRKWHLTKPAILFFRLFEKGMRANLLGANPSLVIFDLYKLGILCLNPTNQ
ncbi:glycosyltransferase [Bacteroidales bacterium OttesenSCG-928-A17]|nr:glycosyltransferase [Bacteroidales bacterium OttesenSCG-928-A17]